MFQGFPKEGLAFLAALKENNSKVWFDANRERYDRLILRPNKAYVQEMGEHLQILVPTIRAIPKSNHSLFRIYRDARQHPSAPIKERIGIIFWQGAGHRMQSSSFYMHYGVNELFVSTGIRKFKPPLLAIYREYIQNLAHRTALHEILLDLKEKGYRLPEPFYKRYPRGFSANEPYAYLARYNAIYAYVESQPDELFHSEAIIDRNFKIYEDMFPLHQWLYAMTCYGRA